MKFAVVLSSLVAAVYAQTINTPESVLACAFHQITFVGGTAPYTILVQPGGSTGAAPLQTYAGIQCSPFTWFVEQPAGTQVFLRMLDSVGASVSTAPFTIQPGTGNGTCTVPTATPTTGCQAGSTATGGDAPPASSAGGGGSSGGSGNTTPAPSGPASSSRPAGSSSTTTGAAFANQVGIAGAVVGIVAAGLAVLA